MIAATRAVPFFRYAEVFTRHEEDFLRIAREVGRRGAFILQGELAAFESRLAAFTGARFAVGVANATDGLHLALRAAGVGEGDEVILCSHTMIATASAVHFTGARPVPVDPGPDHLIDPEAVRRAVTARTRAILPTHLNGRTAEMDAIEAIAAEHGLLVIEDAAQALGSRYRGRAAGTFGAAGVISFYPAKLLGCFGDGGAVLTSDEEIRGRLLELRDHGRDESGRIARWGFNSRLDNLQAAWLDFQLDLYPEAVAARRRLAARYDERLRGLEGLVPPPAPDSDADHFDVFQNYEIEAVRRDELRALLAAAGVGTLVPWGGHAVHAQRHLGFDRHLPHTDRLFERLLMLPLNLSVTGDEVDHVCGCIAAFYGRV